MADSYVGEIRMFAGNYAPDGWALCDGTLLAVSANQALFALIGTTYGGDGVNNFAVPDLRSRLPLGQGQGPGLTARIIGQTVGSEGVALAIAQLPAHSHAFVAASNAASVTAPAGNFLAAPNPATINMFAAVDATKTSNNLATDTLGMSGQTQAHSNMMPSLSIGFIISTTGVYPTHQ
jgi:microcystin-dependent protein